MNLNRHLRDRWKLLSSSYQQSQVPLERKMVRWQFYLPSVIWRKDRFYSIISSYLSQVLFESKMEKITTLLCHQLYDGKMTDNSFTLLSVTNAVWEEDWKWQFYLLSLIFSCTVMKNKEQSLKMLRLHKTGLLLHETFHSICPFKKTSFLWH